MVNVNAMSRGCFPVSVMCVSDLSQAELSSLPAPDKLTTPSLPRQRAELFAYEVMVMFRPAGRASSQANAIGARKLK